MRAERKTPSHEEHTKVLYRARYRIGDSSFRCIDTSFDLIVTGIEEAESCNSFATRIADKANGINPHQTLWIANK